MSLAIVENGAVTLDKERHSVCMDAAYELDAISSMLSGAVECSDEAAMASHLRVRCIAARVHALAGVLMSGLGDDAVRTEDLQSTVMVQ